MLLSLVHFCVVRRSKKVHGKETEMTEIKVNTLLQFRMICMNKNDEVFFCCFFPLFDLAGASCTHSIANVAACSLSE